MEDERLAEKVLNGKFQNRGPVGKPRTAWENVVRRDTSQITRNEETSRGYRGMEACFEGDQSTEGAVAP